MTAIDTLRREYSAREFNRDPSVVSRAAHQFGSVRITNRGVPSLIVVDASQHPELVEPDHSLSLLDSLAPQVTWDEDIVGEPPRARIALDFEVEA